MVAMTKPAAVSSTACGSRPGAPGGAVGGAEHDAVGRVVRRAAPLEGQALHLLVLPPRPVGFPLALRGGVAEHEPRRDVVVGAAPGAQLVGQLARQADLSRL